MRLSRHPSPAALHAWLDTGEPAKVSRHIDECDRCLAVVEELSHLDESLVADLSEVVAAPDDVEDRAARQVANRLRNEAAFTAFVDLFALGWSTTRTLLDVEEDSNV